MVFVDVQLKKQSDQNTFDIIDCEMLIRQRSNQAFSPLVCQARLSHQHPAWHIADCQQICVIVLKSLDTLLKPGDVVSDAFSSFPLELVRGKEHLEAFTLLLWSLLSKLFFKPGHQGFNASAVSVSLAFQIVSDVSRCGQQLLVGHRQTNASCCSSESPNQSRCN